ncbi:hypothetical protein [Microvirga sp. CF3016]|uniref:hypothetical protein n=1 Tax=Microvirga sp. CF3016 TaxID=3110181 RepID=UPI002E798D5B|nr:hypothetical protein [Microvirga sp. CF3016]MEE1611868.1 hypothetical protein [Microvirga sp. CF3016]
MKAGIKFQPAGLCSSLQAIARTSSQQIDQKGRKELEDAASRFLTVASIPNRTHFLWKCAPFATRASTAYKAGENTKRVFAKFWFDWSCERSAQDPDWWIVYNGSVNVEFRLENTPDEIWSKYHIDVCEGGLHVDYDGNGNPSEELGDNPAEKGVRHCFSHIHVGKNIPRIPILLSTPPDVLEMALVELWPIDWKDTVQKTRSSESMKQHHMRQRRRIFSVSRSFNALLSRPYPLLALHERLPEPIVLS